MAEESGTVKNRSADAAELGGLAGVNLAHGEMAHVVQFYEDDAFLRDSVARFVGTGLSAGEAAVVIATREHREALDAQLRSLGLNVSALRDSGRYVSLDAAETLKTFMVDRRPDRSRFADVIGGVIAQSAAGSHRVRAFGEMVAVLWAEGEREAAIRLEELWDDLARQLPFTLLCAYPLAAFGREDDADALRAVCGHHTRVIPTESYTAVTDADAQLRAIAQLQQRARALGPEVAQRKQAEGALQDRNRELTALYNAAEAANRAKDEFLAMLGHELRNPLSAVRNAITAATLDPARRDHALQIARRGTDQLARLVDDLLDVARITQGRITLRTEVSPIAHILERAVDAARQGLQERGLAITLSLPARDLRVDADSARLDQIIGNLLSNAAKYTDAGGRITVSLEHDDGQAVLRVQDTGIGISAEMLPRVFDLFAQADQSLDRSQGGLGIGLTLVKRLVELHGGRVEAHSDGLGAGAEFVVRLPVVQDTSDAAATSGPRAASRASARVLIVEDNADAAESMMLLLELLGHRVRAVGDGPSALEAARANPPDVMLVDIGLPGMDGYELARCVRQCDELRDVILVALTGYGREEDRQHALAAGFDYHLVKPVDLDQFQGLVAQLASPAKPNTVH